MKYCRKCGAPLSVKAKFCSNCGYKTKRLSMPNRRQVIVGLVILLVILGSVITASLPWGRADAITLTPMLDTDGEYILHNVGPDTVFKLSAGSSFAGDSGDDWEENGLCVLTNALSEEIQYTVQEKDDYYIIQPPNGGYEPGMNYTLVLAEGVHFVDELLEDVRILNFTIKKRAVESVSYSENVLDVSEVDYEQIGEDALIIDGDYEIGDILLLDSGEAVFE